jgi:hypothetical protein
MYAQQKKKKTCNVCNKRYITAVQECSKLRNKTNKCTYIKYIVFFYCCTVHVVTINSFIVAPCILLRLFLLLLHRACCYDYFFYCCTVRVVTIISFIVAPCMLLRLFLLLLHRACCYDYFFYCCTVRVVTIISFIPTHAHFHTL